MFFTRTYSPQRTQSIEIMRRFTVWKKPLGLTSLAFFVYSHKFWQHFEWRSLTRMTFPCLNLLNSYPDCMQYRLNYRAECFATTDYYHHFVEWNLNLFYMKCSMGIFAKASVHKRHILEHDSEKPWNAHGLYGLVSFHVIPIFKSCASISINESLSHGSFFIHHMAASF